MNYRYYHLLTRNFLNSALQLAVYSMTSNQSHSTHPPQPTDSEWVDYTRIFDICIFSIRNTLIRSKNVTAEILIV